MASFRILNQAPVYLLADGSVNAGGKLYFYETDLSTPKNTWSDQAMTTLNSNPVVMDAAGRTLTDVWGDGEYGVKMTDASDVLIWTRNNVQASNAESVTIPALESGQFLTNNGSILQWSEIIQVPDPTGQTGDILYSDGTQAYWAPPPEIPDAPDPDIVVSALSFLAGVTDDNTKFFAQAGTDTAPNTGTKTTNKSITFATPFDVIWGVFVTPKTTSSTPAGATPTWSVVGYTQGSASSGCTVWFNIPDDDSNAAWKFNTTVPFDYIAFGTREVAP